MTSGFITSNGLKIFYEIEGKGQPLILLNGGPGLSHEYLQNLLPLASDAKLIFFDQRGTGRSDRAELRDYTIDANVEDVENVRRELDLDSCMLFGHSWGGMLAQEYVLKYPDNVTKLILSNTVSSIIDINIANLRMRHSVPEAMRAIYDRYEQEGLYKNSERLPDEYQVAVQAAFLPVYIKSIPPQYLMDVLGNLAMDVHRAMWGEESEFTVTGTLAKFDVTDRLHEIRIPSLVMVSATDIPSMDMVEKMTRAIPNSRLVVFENSCHFPFIDEQDRFINVVREFIRSQE
jgi:proline iminopeptidase